MTRSSQLRSRLAEATAIVLSILLAFAIDAWWQQIVERREEVQLLSALRTEFAVNLERVAEISAFHADLRATAEALLSAAADSGSEPGADSVAKLIADVSWWGGFTGFESATLSAVILGGKLDLIQNEDLGSQFRELLANREFQNALVQKIWIEDDLLSQYRLLEPKVSEIIQALDEEIAR